MVDVAAVGGCAAGGEIAAAVTGADIAGEGVRWPVAGGAVVAGQAALGIGQDPLPLRVVGQRGQVPRALGSDRAVADQPARVVVRADQGGGGHDHVDPPGLAGRDWSAIAAAQVATVGGQDRAAGDQVDQDVSSPGARGAGVVGAAGGLGQGAELLVRRDQVGCRQVGHQVAHPVLDPVRRVDRAPGHGLDLAAPGRVWVDRDHRGPDRGPGLRHGDHLGAGQHPVGGHYRQVGRQRQRVLVQGGGGSARDGAGRQGFHHLGQPPGHGERIEQLILGLQPWNTQCESDFDGRVPRHLAFDVVAQDLLRGADPGLGRRSVMGPALDHVVAALTQVGQHQHLLGLDEPLEPGQTLEHLNHRPPIGVSDRRQSPQQISQRPAGQLGQRCNAQPIVLCEDLEVDIVVCCLGEVQTAQLGAQRRQLGLQQRRN